MSDHLRWWVCWRALACWAFREIIFFSGISQKSLSPWMATEIHLSWEMNLRISQLFLAWVSNYSFPRTVFFLLTCVAQLQCEWWMWQHELQLSVLDWTFSFWFVFFFWLFFFKVVYTWHTWGRCTPALTGSQLQQQHKLWHKLLLFSFVKWNEPKESKAKLHLFLWYAAGFDSENQIWVQQWPISFHICCISLNVSTFPSWRSCLLCRMMMMIAYGENLVTI